MKVNETIRTMRELNQFTQEEMAEKLGITPNSYSKLERGISKISLERLEQIAQIFNINVSELYATKEKGFYYFLSEHNGSNYYSNDQTLLSYNKELEIRLKHKNEIIEKLNDEIQSLKKIISLLEK
ncbi:hypothetical protein BKK51_07250 [Rodentibacter trehalosifermentans]|uniref:HTH cro/C1-type domain-containing protein n=1 Tax=Rodentibacter trehalosifermentans TaxID=1908263 RepID=A0A1V3ITI1_9PAST|nr:helix-turn-helix transcriptional regulator [Rodentibacter trehalosifermentans]OOF45219.1 hypothetical protein BKK51_07250 [Rodentibacter trehalosifermentans]